MTREYAGRVAKALDDIEAFEVFMDMIGQTVNRAEEDIGIDLGEFNSELEALLKEELKRRAIILANL